MTPITSLRVDSKHKANQYWSGTKSGEECPKKIGVAYALAKASGNMALKLKLWGVRGSIACATPQHMKYGGNTSCIEVRAGDHCELVPENRTVV